MRLLLLLLFIGNEVLSQCPPGSSVVFSNNNQLVSCSPQSSCPCASARPGAFCQYSSQYNQFVCCATTSSQCPSGSAQLSPNGQVVFCSSDSQCTRGFSCNFGTCCAIQNFQCADGNGGTTPPGSLCQPSSQCSGGSQCTNGVCLCPGGGIGNNGQCSTTNNCTLGYVSVNNQCMPMAPPNGQCSSNLQCLDNSMCNGNTCSCQSNSQFVSGYCIPFNGGPCSISQVQIDGNCVTYSIVGGSCIRDPQCVGGARCQNGVCQCTQNTQRYCFTSSGYQQCFCLSSSTSPSCQPGQVLVNGACLPQINAGSYGCQSSLQCLGNSQCNGGLCQCPQGQSPQNGQCPSCQFGTVSVNGFCQQLAPPGAQCSSSLQCLENSACNGNACICQNGAQNVYGYCLQQSGFCSINQVSVGGTCVTYSIVGGSCMADAQCLGGSSCQSGACRCRQGTQSYCVSPSGYQQCYCLSTTGGQNPQCPNGQVLVNGACLPQINLGGWGCQSTLQCLGNSQCIQGGCQCGQGQTQQNGQCVGGSTNNNVAAPGTSCSFNQQCLDGSICNGNMCMCQGGRQLMSNYCLPVKTDNCQASQVNINGECVTFATVGGSCIGNQQCLGGSICQSRVCQCVQGVQRYCIQLSSGYQQCYCAQGGTNQCNSGQVWVNGQCMPQIYIGGFGCTYNEQCMGNSQCSGGSCQCPFGTTQQNGQCISNNGGGQCKPYQVSVGGNCLDTVSIGQSCSNQAQCITNSFCSGTCTCASGLSYNGTACANTAMSCSQGTVFASNRCLALVQLGQYCQVTAQCIGFGVCSSDSFCSCPSGSSAINGVCRSGNVISPCNNNQILIGSQCYDTRPIGSSCILPQQCLGNSICQSAVCVCPPNTQNYGDGTCRSASMNDNMCAAGETPMYSNGQLINCFLQSCPSGSLCKYNSLASKYVCCRSTTMSCSNPSWTVVYQNGSPINCLQTTCPSNSICDVNNGQYTCCQPGSSSSTCTGNFFTYSDGRALICTADSTCNDNTFRYCRRAPGQSYSVCCDRS